MRSGELAEGACGNVVRVVSTQRERCYAGGFVFQAGHKIMGIALSGYAVAECIHDGSRSRVYRGVRQSDKLPVIVKVHRNEYPAFTELSQYRNHYTLTRSLDVPGVARPLALERHGNGFAIVWEDTGAVP